MMHVWQWQEAQNKFSEFVDQAIKSGPQLITKRGVKSAILLSWAEYRRLTATQQKLSVFFRESPLAEESLGFERDTSNIRPEPVL
jgi:prevent-host-death family protein